MHYIHNLIGSKYPQLANFADEISLIHDACRGTYSSISIRTFHLRGTISDGSILFDILMISSSSQRNQRYYFPPRRAHFYPERNCIYCNYRFRRSHLRQIYIDHDNILFLLGGFLSISLPNQRVICFVSLIPLFFSHPLVL